MEIAEDVFGVIFEIVIALGIFFAWIYGVRSSSRCTRRLLTTASPQWVMEVMESLISWNIPYGAQNLSVELF